MAGILVDFPREVCSHFNTSNVFVHIVDMGAKAQVATDDQGTKLPGDGTRSHPDLPSEQLGFAALVDQQREIMRYMRGLDKWMERERTARSELLGSLNEKLDRMKAPLQSKLSESSKLWPYIAVF